jgi:transposase
MKRFVEGEDRRQGVLLPEFLDDYVAEDNPVRVIDVFVDELDLHALGFAGVVPEATGRPAYHPATMLKVYLLRVSEPGPVEPPAGARDAAQHRTDVADRALDA